VTALFIYLPRATRHTAAPSAARGPPHFATRAPYGFTKTPRVLSRPMCVPAPCGHLSVTPPWVRGLAHHLCPVEALFMRSTPTRLPAGTRETGRARSQQSRTLRKPGMLETDAAISTSCAAGVHAQQQGTGRISVSLHHHVDQDPNKLTLHAARTCRTRPPCPQHARATQGSREDPARIPRGGREEGARRARGLLTSSRRRLPISSSSVASSWPHSHPRAWASPCCRRSA